MFKLICTSYNVLDDGSLQLRNNWVEDADDSKLEELIERWNVKNDFNYPSKNSISNILEGVMQIDCPIHIRIVRF